jgi:CubicO group peptidase (beta-lactamase class C family)
MTTYGFIIDGMHYTGGCGTRFGAYPYCSWIRLPSYSTGKSAFTSMTLMAMGEQFGPGVENLLIKDYVPEHASSSGDWSTTTFGHTVDMTSGNYRFATYMRDEGSLQMDDFFLSETYADRISEAFSWPSKAAPGTNWVYHTSDYFILGRAMQNYLVNQLGSGTDVFDYMVSTIFEPLKIGPGAHTTLRTSDNNWDGQAIAGYGLWFVPDDVAKITELIHDGGAVGANQILEPGMLADAMCQNPSFLGHDAGYARQRYNNGFWSYEYGSAEGYTCDFCAAFMSGYGGITILPMPNGTTYYYFSDNDEFTQYQAVEESDGIYPMCP